MTARKLILFLLILFIMGACGEVKRENRYDHADFSFSYPGKWHLMSDLWPDYTIDNNYKNLGIVEIITVTSVQKQGKFGLWFTVASTSLDGDDLETMYKQTYASIKSDIRDVVESIAVIDNSSAFEINYSRPFGDPWWEFRDIWLEKEGNAYVLSAHALNLDSYQNEVDSIIDSFTFK